MNPNVAVGVLNRFLYAGYESGLFRHVISHVVKQNSAYKKSLRPATDIGMIETNRLSIDEYIRIIEEERYSAILFDYALIGIEAETEGNKIIRHRYTYIPCPIHALAMADVPEELGIADFFRQLDRTSLASHFVSNGYIRFDYTNDESTRHKNHPYSHMTFISANCRVPLRSPISVSDFITFLFDNFYIERMQEWNQYQPYLRSELEDTIQLDEMSRMHIYWADHE